MVFEEVIGPELSESLKPLIRIFQIIGGLLGVYILFWTINVFVNTRRVRVLKKILENVEEINKKLGKGKKK